MGKLIKFERRRSLRKDRRFLKLAASTGLVVVAVAIGLRVYPPQIPPTGILAPPLSQGESASADEMQPGFYQPIHFDRCYTGGGRNCVVDGDTFWIDGFKVRVADIDAPETHPPRCAHEADLGYRAAARLQELLNAGPIQMQSGSSDEDRYGRKLRIVVRDGKSLGMQLVSEGLARQWTGSRKPWC
jgi:endonuclease YncB( thermonuclease family)